MYGFTLCKINIYLHSSLLRESTLKGIFLDQDQI